nr:reverse transcriptase domain-containing protein [Tanacetum cinerariifolium]
MIVRSPSPYNGIIGRPGIREIQAIPSTAHGMLKFPVNGRIVTIHSTILTPTECITIMATPKDLAKKAEARHKNFKVAIHLDFPDQEITIGRTVSIKARTKLCTLLKRNLDIFMAVVRHDRSTMIDCRAPTQYPRRIFPCQIEKRGQAPERAKAIQVEVQKLLEAGILREVHYHDWLSNPVMVKKHDGSWRIAISAVLITERDTVQTPVYFVSRAMQAPELNYTPMEKLVLALVYATKRLRRYFQVHPIVTSVKDQILADFLVEKPDDAPPDTSVIETLQEPWTLFMDGSSCVDGSGVRLILISPEGTEFTYALRFQFTASNNEAECEALIARLRITTQMGVCNVHVRVDSKLVVNQVLGTYVTKEENMVKYLEKTKSLISGFANFFISQVPRSKNKKVDALSKIASTSFAHLSKQVLVEVLKEKSIQEEEVAIVVEEEGPTWMTSIMEYLKDGALLDDKKKESKLRIKAR